VDEQDGRDDAMLCHALPAWVPAPRIRRVSSLGREAGRRAARPQPNCTQHTQAPALAEGATQAPLILISQDSPGAGRRGASWFRSQTQVIGHGFGPGPDLSSVAAPHCRVNSALVPFFHPSPPAPLRPQLPLPSSPAPLPQHTQRSIPHIHHVIHAPTFPQNSLHDYAPNAHPPTC
jgi:hypothetical protein